jgi:hypothetical protein
LPSDFLNLLVCATILYGCWWFRTQWKASPEVKPHHAYLATAFVWWTLSWASWFALYAVKLLLRLTEEAASPLWRVVLVLLTDVNSILMLTCAFAIASGDRWRQQASRLQLFLGAVIAVELLRILVFLGYEQDLSLAVYSIPLGTLAPVVLGYVFLLRYGTRYVLWAGLAYGLLQPIAYVASLPKEDAFITLSVTTGARCNPELPPELLPPPTAPQPGVVRMHEKYPVGEEIAHRLKVEADASDGELFSILRAFDCLDNLEKLALGWRMVLLFRLEALVFAALAAGKVVLGTWFMGYFAYQPVRRTLPVSVIPPTGKVTPQDELLSSAGAAARGLVWVARILMAVILVRLWMIGFVSAAVGVIATIPIAGLGYLFGATPHPWRNKTAPPPSPAEPG